MTETTWGPSIGVFTSCDGCGSVFKPLQLQHLVPHDGQVYITHQGTCRQELWARLALDDQETGND